jgi:hypothetical protein
VYAEAILVIEAVSLSIVLVLALAVALIARRSWLGKARSPWPGFVVFSIVCALSIFATSRGLGPVTAVGWVAIILSGAALLAQTSTMWE